MTEQEYITVQELTNVVAIRDLLSEIIVPNSEIILQEDYYIVSQIVRKWEKILRETIKINNK